MKKDSAKYREWKRRQNEKNLLIRTKKRIAKRHAKTAKNWYNYELKHTAEYNVETRNYDFHAPLNFSFINNAEETSSFFNEIILFITNSRNFGKSIFIDISGISRLTIDALMYLLAIVNNLSANFKGKYSFSGNAPKDLRVRKLFSESGFHRFVRYQGTEPLTRSSDTIQIVSGEKCDTDLAKRLSDFVCEKANMGDTRCCSFLYNMMIELMSNTHKHAYPEENGVLHARWYCFAEYNSKENIVTFSFMDTGAGIPATVKKNFAEKIDILGLKGEHKYVVSALDGEFRTATHEGHRGKGLPKIREFCSNRKIEHLHILTNRADVIVLPDGYDSKDFHTPLCGTLYSWQINLSSL